MFFIPEYTWIVTNFSSVLYVGRHILVMKDVSTFAPLPIISVPKQYTIEDKGVIIEKTIADEVNRKYYVYFTIVDNPVPVAAIVVGILVVLGLSLTIMAFDRIERIIDTSNIGALVGTVAQSPVFVFIVLGIILLITWKKSGIQGILQ